MGISTVGFVALPEGYNPDVFEVKDRIVEALGRMQIDGMKVWVADPVMSHRSLYIRFMVSPVGLNYLQAKKDACTIHRRLSVHFDCHSDHSDVYEGRKLMFSLDTTNIAHQAIRAILGKFTDVGVCYFIPNDCEDVYEVLNAA